MEILQIIRFVLILLALALCPLVILQARKLQRLSKEFRELANINAEMLKQFNDKLIELRKRT